MIEAPITGERDAAVRADIAIGQMRNKLPELGEALRTRIEDLRCKYQVRIIDTD